MLSFKIIDSDNRDEVIDLITLGIEDVDLEYIDEIVDSLLEDTDSEYALAVSNGCLLIRVFDSEYSFIYPVAVCEGAEESAAAYSVREYAVKQEIPLVYTDIPAEEIGNIAPLFRHVSIDAQDDEGETFTLRVMSEVMLLEELPSMETGQITLDAICENDDEDYARLCKDEETNKFWGYDYSCDNDDPEDSYFREMAENELDRGVALALAVRHNGRLVGEAALYSFDLLGGCECAVRILPEYRGRGFAKASIAGLREICAKMGIVNLYATVDNRNGASISLFTKCFGKGVESGEKTNFHIKM